MSTPGAPRTRNIYWVRVTYQGEFGARHRVTMPFCEVCDFDPVDISNTGTVKLSNGLVTNLQALSEMIWEILARSSDRIICDLRFVHHSEVR